jgi:hypothetical protein
MANEFTAELTGEEEYIRRLTHVPEAVRPFMFRAAGTMRKEGKERAKPHAVDLGTLANTVRSEVDRAGIPLYARAYTNNPIAAQVEEGRHPGGRAPTVRRAARWLTRHGVTGVNWAAWARMVGERGTRAVRFMAKAGEVTAAKLPSMIRDAEREIQSKWRR